MKKQLLVVAMVLASSGAFAADKMMGMDKPVSGTMMEGNRMMMKSDDSMMHDGKMEKNMSHDKMMKNDGMKKMDMEKNKMDGRVTGNLGETMEMGG